MRIGLGLPGPWKPWETFADLVRDIQRMEAAGFASAWLGNVSRFDALTALAVAGRETNRIELASCVVPTYPRHPAALAQQALTVQAAANNRLTLGIGLSHKVMIEGWYGLDYSKPIRHLREYLTILNGLLTGERTKFEGSEYRVSTQLTVPGTRKPPVLVAALGPQTLRLCGQLADGTITAMGGLAYLRDVAVPTISDAARQAGRPSPRVVALLQVCVTDDIAAARTTINEKWGWTAQMPSYQATMARSGASETADIAVLGRESAVTEQLRALSNAGVTDLAALIDVPSGERVERTTELLASLNQAEMMPA